MSEPHTSPVLGTIAVVLHQDRVILVQRGKPPKMGQWGFPGGHVELGETALDGAVRELREETGIQARACRYLTNLDVILRNETGALQRHFLLTAVLCEYISGDLKAADDAQAALWVPLNQLNDGSLPLIDRVAEIAELAHRVQTL